MSKVVILSGSPSVSSRLNGMVNFVRKTLAEAGLNTAIIEVVDLPPEDLVYANFNSPTILAANELIAAADAVVIASPVYKASYTGVLKAYIDLLPQKGFEKKLIAPVFIAGSMAHMLVVDYALKPVLASMGATHFTKTVYATDDSITREQDKDGQYRFTIEESIKARLQGIADELIEYLK
ncbi:NADPH-dependent FMN reductase [Paenibacillus sp. FSL W7-1287]|uniref:NADPH-dependent FMN reductase n=1 Tax=Paenibacillus sp. FSL W7-1287 TaxID=2954538 RepID=UPI0030FC03B2